MDEEGEVKKILGIPYVDFFMGLILGAILGFAFFLATIVPYTNDIAICQTIVLMVGGMAVVLYRFVRSAQTIKSQNEIPYQIGALLVALISGGIFLFSLLILTSLVTPFTIPPIQNSAGTTLELHNNPLAKQQPWSAVREFVLSDPTKNAYKYSYPNFTSGDYAVRLHDNAERAGLEAGVADIKWSYDGFGGIICPWRHEDHHIVTVFNTTDGGLIYIDDTAWPVNQEWPVNDSSAYGPWIARVEESSGYGIMTVKDNDPTAKPEVILSQGIMPHEEYVYPYHYQMVDMTIVSVRIKW